MSQTAVLGHLKQLADVAHGVIGAQVVAGANQENGRSGFAVGDIMFLFLYELFSINRPKKHLKSTTSLTHSWKQ